MIHADRVSFHYLHAEHGLPETSLRVQAGEKWLVSGASGCGKSTLARCLSGLIPHLYRGCFTGEVVLNGFRTTETPMWKLAEQAGMLFQNPSAQLLAATVEEEIIFGLEQLGCGTAEIDKRVAAAMHSFQLEEFRNRAPQTLSDGEKQKLALAAVMARDPKILILDEPLSMLDSTAEQELIQELERASGEGTAAILFEHRETELRLLENLNRLELDGKSPPQHTLAPCLSWKPMPSFELWVRDLGVTLGGKRVLDQINVDFHGGEIVAIVGRNGAGKTTLLRALAGLQKHDGALRLQGDGEPLQLGLVFQNPDLQLFNASVREEILFHIEQPDPDYYRWLLDVLALTRYDQAQPLLLSEGEKKRLGLGTVLMRRPRHGILLDEPSLGQDEAHKKTLMHLLQYVATLGRLVVVTTHDLELARQADRVILLGGEGIAGDGPAAEIFARQDLWESIGLKRKQEGALAGLLPDEGIR
ncbi:MAG: ABC transporter ATP-binding protein [Anaerolineales bacterium]|nr:ABC transporter ATP-binding protein [Anaerolineales bacterium]